MNKRLRWILIAFVALGLTVLMAGRHDVLNSRKLTASIQAELPNGSSKPQVKRFLEARQLVAYEDTGPRVRARLSGRAENIIYRKDIVISFDFDSQDRLTGYSKQEYLTFF